MRSLRLLIVDDDPMIGQLLLTIAQGIGAEAKVRGDAEEFLHEVASWDPTHVVIDLVMPGMDGVEVLGRLAATGCRAKVIIASGVGSRVLDAAARSAAEHGLDLVGVLPKPFRPSDLRLLLQRSEQPQQSGWEGGGGGKRWAPDIGALKEAIEKDQLSLHYQPKVRCTTGELAGFEALLRWQHPEHGHVPPMDFIPLAESTGLIDPLTDRVVELAVDWFAHNLKDENGFPREVATSLTVAINLSSRSLADIEFLDRVCAICESREVAPTRLIFELTETAAMEDPVQSLDLLTRLRMKGFRLSIDDFGTGYSSMLQLIRLPFSEIKVDRSFVGAVMHSDESRAVVRAVVELGRSLSLQTVAEGVEDEGTLRFLRSAGCDLAQGFFIARPMAGDAAVDWARSLSES